MNLFHHLMKQTNSQRSAGLLVVAVISFSLCGAARAQVPGEVTNLDISPASLLTWNTTATAADYSIYRAQKADLHLGGLVRCHGYENSGTSFSSPEDPGIGETFVYLVTARNASGEGTPGTDGDGTTRLLMGTCETIIRNHVFDRTGYGWDEWARDRLAALGRTAYINEQLAPATIDESTNTNLNDRMIPLTPPLDCRDMVSLKIVNGTYARRQLEEQTAVFWDNHYSTDCIKVRGEFDDWYPPCASTNPNVPPECDPNHPQERDFRTAEAENNEYATFESLAFTGTFRDQIIYSALYPPMMIYLDTIDNTDNKPNENYGRELLELYTMGVDGGYTQTDVEEAARIFSGWNVCNKTAANQNDPLASCRTDWWNPDDGFWVANFRDVQHDAGQKTLFAGTPYETIIPDTSSTPTDGVDDVDLAIDGIVAHPSTAEFISTKLLQKFITETPPQTMIDTVVAEWDDGSNPLGVGDLLEVLKAVVTHPRLLSADEVGNKIKTPLETIASNFRATRGETNGDTQVYSFLNRMSHRPNYNEIPTGYSELGSDWLDTNNILERQNFGLRFPRNTPTSNADYSADVIGLLTDNGISTAPGNAEAIIDFFIDVIYGGAINPAERQAAIDYLNTNNSGTPSNYNDARIRETIGFMLGFAQNFEQ